MNSNTILTIKVVVTLGLAAAGIAYILYTPPTSQISGYEKQPMKKPATVQRKSSTKNRTTKEASDSVSLTGKKGRYDETRIGKNPD